MNFKNATRSAIEAMSAEEVKLWVLECIADNAKQSAPKVKELDFTQFVSTDKLRPTINYVYEQVGKFRCATDTHILLYEYLGEDMKLAKSDMRSSSEPIRLYDKKNKMVYEGTIDDLNLARKNEEYYEFWTKFPDAPRSFGIYPNVHQVIDYPSNMYKDVIEIDLDEYEDGLREVEELNKETLAEKKEYKKKAKLGLLKDNEYGIVFRDILDDALFFVGGMLVFNYSVMKKIVCICRQFGTNKIKVDVDVTKEGIKVTCRGVFVENKDGRKLALFMPLISQISLCDDFYNNNQSKFALLGPCYALPK